MKDKNFRRHLICLALGLFIIAISADALAESSISIRWGQKAENDHSPELAKHKKNGPPDHAPAHGYRAKHQYRYYPSKSVYHDPDRGLYFYIKGDNWEVGASLPTGLKANLGDYVKLELETDKPYVHNQEHRQKYPPGKSKPKQKKKIAKNSKK